MRLFNNKNNEEWQTRFSDDEAYQRNNLLKGELLYRKSICQMALRNHLSYSNDGNFNYENNFTKRTVVLINGELRTPYIFINWIKRIDNFAFIYIYTDKSSFMRLKKTDRNLLERISTELLFSEDDESYAENVNRKGFQKNMHQWLKLKQSIMKWQEEWRGKSIKNILRMRCDIPFLYPFCLENNIKNGFSSHVFKGKMMLRSDLLFSFDFSDVEIMSKFFEKIFEFYLNPEWIKYPYSPLNPDIIINSKGGSRIEWCSFPSKFIGNKPSKYSFFESISNSYESLFVDYINIKNNNLTTSEKINLFGDLSTVRRQPENIFASEKCFAHYLASNNITCSSHNQLFSGPIIREKNFKK